MKLSSEDLLVILALCRERTLEGAGVSLGKDPSSIFRAIKRIEGKLGHALFSRSRDGFHPFGMATELAEKAATIHAALVDAEAIHSALNSDLTGRLRITTTDVLLEYVILPNLFMFRDQYPQIQIDFSTQNDFSKLWERGVDIAIRPASAPPEDAIGQFVKEIEYVVVCGQDYLDSKPAAQSECDGLDWLLPGGELSKHPINSWFSEHVRNSMSLTSFDSLNLAIRATRANLGVSVVPDLPNITEGLIRLPHFVMDEKTELWCLYHASNKGNPLVGAFCKFVRQILK